MTTPPPAWHPDPSNPKQLRWWDGQQWTENTQPLPESSPPAPDLNQPAEQNQMQQPIQLAGQATIISADDDNQDSRPTVTLVYAIITGLVVAIANVILVLVLFALAITLLVKISGQSISSGEGLPGISLILALVIFTAIVTFSVWLYGALTAKIFDRRNFSYRSRWNLIVAYPLASIVIGIVSAIVTAIVGAVFGQGTNNNPPAIIVIVVFVILIAFALFFLGQMLIWTSSWDKVLAKVLGLAYLIISIVNILVMTLIIGAVFSLVSGLIGLSTNSDDSDSDTYRAGETVSYITQSSTTLPIKYRVSFKMPEGDTKVSLSNAAIGTSTTPGSSSSDQPAADPSTFNYINWSRSGGIAQISSSGLPAGECYSGESLKEAVRKGESLSQGDVAIADGVGANGNYWVAVRPSETGLSPTGEAKENIYFRVASPNLTTGTGLFKEYCGIKIPAKQTGNSNAKQIAATVLLTKQP